MTLQEAIKLLERGEKAGGVTLTPAGCKQLIDWFRTAQNSLQAATDSVPHANASTQRQGPNDNRDPNRE